jgi:4-hydroxy-4-methyl-2-oxoglutarate aldolase
MSKTPAVAGDETTGRFVPPDVRPSSWRRLDPHLLAKLAELSGLTPTASDVLDELGIALVVGADVLQPRVPGARVAGQAVTLRYLPERRAPSSFVAPERGSRLAHHVAYDLCEPGDVLIIDAGGATTESTFGGMAALDASRRQLGGIVVDGAIRDIDQIGSLGLPAWSRSVTPRTGKWRLECVQVNGPVGCAGVHVQPGDLVLADASGVCFVPLELADEAIGEILEVATREAGHMARRPRERG